MLVLVLLSLPVGIITFVLAWGPFGLFAAIGLAIGAGALAIVLAGLWFVYGARRNGKAAESVGKNRHEHLEPRNPPVV
jgi:hypothetical protein